MKPFIDNKRGATMRHRAHKVGIPEPLRYRRPLFVGSLGACVALILLLSV